jgi:WD40 repeat protein
MAIFVSYSRRDAAFVRQLHEGIVARGRETWVDWEGIPPTADWMREIHRAIEAAEAVVFVLSPDSIASTVCAQELAHAVTHHKRLIPVVCRTVEPTKTPPELARLNWIVFADAAFKPTLDTLLSAVETDLEWVEAHTRLLVRAIEWDRRQRETSLTLRGADLEQAERWLTNGPNKAPPPTELQTRYILDSRRQATRRRTLQLGIGAIALVLIATFGTLAWLQRIETARQEAVAVARRLAAAAERVRDAPLEYSNDTSRMHIGAHLAGEALRRVEAVGERLVEADVAVRRVLAALPERIVRLAGVPHGADFQALVFGTRGELVAASPSVSAIWTAPLSDDSGERSESASAAKVVLSPDGGAIAAIEPNHRSGQIEVRAVAKPGARGVVQLAGTTSYAALNIGGAELLTSSQQYSQGAGWHGAVSHLWRVGAEQALAELPFVTDPVFSPDGALLVGVIGKALTVWRVERLRSGDATPLHVLGGDTEEIGKPLFSADGKHLLVSRGEDPVQLEIWEPPEGRLVRRFAPPPETWPVAVGPDAHYVAFATSGAAAGAGRILLFDSVRGCVGAEVPMQSMEPAAAFARDGATVAVVVNDGIDVLRVPARCGDAVAAATVPGAQAIAFAPDERALVVLGNAGKEMSLQRVELDTDHQNQPTSLGSAGPARFSADGTLLTVASSGVVRWIDAASERERGSVPLSGAVEALAISAEGGMLVAATEKQLHAWQLDPLRVLPVVSLPDSLDARPGALTIHRDGVVAITRARASRIGEALTLRTFALPSMQPGQVEPIGRDRGGFAANVCGLSQDGARVAIHAARSRITVREISSGRDLGTVDEAGQAPQCAFSADGRLLGVGDQAIRVWDIAAQSEIARIESPAKVQSVAFSPSGRTVAAVLDDDTVAVWPLRPRELIERLCARLPGNLGQQDWERFVGREPVQPLCVAAIRP